MNQHRKSKALAESAAKMATRVSARSRPATQLTASRMPSAWTRSRISRPPTTPELRQHVMPCRQRIIDNSLDRKRVAPLEQVNDLRRMTPAAEQHDTQGMNACVTCAGQLQLRGVRSATCRTGQRPGYRCQRQVLQVHAELLRQHRAGFVIRRASEDSAGDDCMRAIEAFGLPPVRRPLRSHR